MDNPQGMGVGTGLGHKQQQERPHSRAELPSRKGEDSTEFAEGPFCNNLGMSTAEPRKASFHIFLTKVSSACAV